MLIHDTLVLRLAPFFPGAFPASLPLQYSQKPRRFLCHSRGRKPSEEETEYFPGNRIAASGFVEVVDGIHTTPDSLGSKRLSSYLGLPSSRVTGSRVPLCSRLSSVHSSPLAFYYEQQGEAGAVQQLA